MPCALDEDEAVLRGGGDVAVDIAQESRRVTVGEAVVGADERGSRVGDLFGLREVAVRLGVDIVQETAPNPVVGRGHGTFHPAHQQERQHLVARALLVQLHDDMSFVGGDARSHIVKIGR